MDKIPKTVLVRAFLFSRSFFVLPAFLFCHDFFILPWLFYFAMTFLFCRGYFILPSLLCCHGFCFSVAFCFAVAFLFCRDTCRSPYSTNSEVVFQHNDSHIEKLKATLKKNLMKLQQTI